MAIDLASFDLHEMLRCSRELREGVRQAPTIEETTLVAGRVALNVRSLAARQESRAGSDRGAARADGPNCAEQSATVYSTCNR